MNWHLKLCSALLFCSFCIVTNINTTNAETSQKNETSATSTTVAPIANTSGTTISTTKATPKPKGDILKSDVCKKCSCDAKTKRLDCSAKTNQWFTAEQWAALQNGDIIFETVILQNNNFTNIPVLPPYPVKNLDLSHNNISAIAIEAFANLTELVKLDLSYNNITAKILVPDVFKSKTYSPSAVNPMSNMTLLNLGYNDLHTLNDDLFEHLPNLENLTLCNNPFQILTVNTHVAISGLSKLKYLDLSYIEISKLPESIFHSTRELETLILSGNLFKEIPDSIQFAKHLKMLCLDENPITDLKDKNVFPELNELEVLKISYMPDLTRIESGAFGKLPKLKTLIASDNKKLSYIDTLAFAKRDESQQSNAFNPIKELNLRNNNLTFVNRDWFRGWANITVIDLEHNPWNCDCDNKFLIRELIEQINKNTPLLTKSVECATPNDWKATSVLLIAQEHRSLPCEDDKASSVAWACLLVTILIILPVAVAGFVLYRRGCFGLRARFSRADDRALYSRATFTDDFHI